MTPPKILLPLSWLYGLITDIRNLLYDKHILPSVRVSVRTIGVGNLEVGGTGKTPCVEYLIKQYKDKTPLAVLSRGYRRQTHGYVEVTTQSSFSEVGDEMKQIKNKFPNIPMAVCENRITGINNLLNKYPHVQLIILDDVFQHRHLVCDQYILLTTYDRPYFNDYMLPYGRLREKSKNAKRANQIIVTKCPSNIANTEKQTLLHNLHSTSLQNVRFATIKYETKKLTGRVLVVTGIAHPHYLLQHVIKTNPDAELLSFPDHHAFSLSVIDKIVRRASRFDTIVTTEKDMMRFEETEIAKKLSIPLISLRIEMSFID